MTTSLSSHPVVDRAPRSSVTLLASRQQRLNMWSLADRMVKAVSDVTVGTVIVLFHVALADRSRKAALSTPSNVQSRRLRA
jgi:hypothetical protein